MSNFGELKTLLLQTSVRSDITMTQLDAFIKNAIRRAQRLLKTPASEVIGTLITTTASNGVIDIPPDLLQIVSIDVDGVELTRTNLTDVNKLMQIVGSQSTHFCRDQHTLRIGPIPPVGAKIRLVYMSNFAALADDTDENWLTRTAPELIIAGAMVDLCRQFVDLQRMSLYEDLFQRTVSELNNMAAADELTNAAMPIIYSFDF